MVRNYRKLFVFKSSLVDVVKEKLGIVPDDSSDSS